MIKRDKTRPKVVTDPYSAGLHLQRMIQTDKRTDRQTCTHIHTHRGVYCMYSTLETVGFPIIKGKLENLFKISLLPKCQR